MKKIFVAAAVALTAAFGAAASSYNIDWSKVTISNFQQLYGPNNNNSTDDALTMRLEFDINYSGTEAATGKLLFDLIKANGDPVSFHSSDEFSFTGPGTQHMSYSGVESSSTTFSLGQRTLKIKTYGGSVLSEQKIEICNYSPLFDATLSTIDPYAGGARINVDLTCTKGPYLGYLRLALYSDAQHTQLVATSETEHVSLLTQGTTEPHAMQTVEFTVNQSLTAGTTYYIALQRTKAATQLNDLWSTDKPQYSSITFTGPTTITPTATSGIEDVEVAEEATPVEYFNLQGQRIAKPEAGVLHIRRMGGKAQLER